MPVRTSGKNTLKDSNYTVGLEIQEIVSKVTSLNRIDYNLIVRNNDVHKDFDNNCFTFAIKCCILLKNVIHTTRVEILTL